MTRCRRRMCNSFQQTIAQIKDLMKRDGEAMDPVQVAAAPGTAPAASTTNG